MVTEAIGDRALSGKDEWGFRRWRDLPPSYQLFLVASAVGAGLLLLSAGVAILLHERAAFHMLLFASTCAAGLVLVSGLARYGPRRQISADIDVDASLPTALEWTRVAMQALAPSRDVQVDMAERTVTMRVPWSWRSYGEDVTATVSIHDADSAMVHVVSQLLVFSLFDYGKNRRNIEAVTRALHRLEGS
jgi:hypothetical protein